MKIRYPNRLLVSALISCSMYLAACSAEDALDNAVDASFDAVENSIDDMEVAGDILEEGADAASEAASEAGEDVETSGSNTDAASNDLGGVTGSGSGQPITVSIENDGNLSDEIITDSLLVARQLIIGTWEGLNPGTQCVVTLRFADDATFTSTSLDEVSSGTYDVYLEEADNATLSIELDIDEDNQLPDCEGDNSSSAESYFISYLSFQSSDVMRFSELPGGNGNFVVFVRKI